MQRRKARNPQGIYAREKIAQAALEVFALHGYEGASTRDIARAAGVNQGLITYYYGTKQALWKACVDRVFVRLFDRYVAVPPAATQRETLRIAIRTFVRFAAENPEVHRFMIHEAGANSPRLRWMMKRYVQPLFGLVSDLLGRARAERGPAIAITPEQLFTLLVGAAPQPFATAAAARHLFGVDPRNSEFVDGWATFVEQLVLPP